MRTRHVALSALVASLTFALTMPGSTSPATQTSAAVNALADSARLAQVTAAATAPGAPKVSVNWVRSTEANFSWSVASGGSAITAHILRVATGGVVVDEKRWDARTSIWISDLRPGTAYQLSIAAVNGVGTGVISSAVVSAAVASTGVTTTAVRLAGADRFQTAVAISKATFKEPGVPAVYIASGWNFADALAGAAAAGHRGGPVLLTSANSIPSSVPDEVRRLRPQWVVVLGGPTVVSDSVVSKVFAAAAF